MSMTHEAHSELESPHLNIASASDYFQLLKPRVMSLVIFTALVGALLAPGTIHPFILFVSILCIAVGAGASGAFNMWYDRDVDRLMKRTQSRPVAAGRISSENTLAFAIILSVGSVATLALVSNWLSAGILAFTIFFYFVIYTVLLKRRTPQNIVIGGAAGAFPPVIGWTVVTNSISLEPILLFTIIFLWTPPHFWALALHTSQDYAKARIPMLPIVSGTDVTKRQILIYAALLVLSSIVPFVVHMVNYFYLAIAGGLGAVFLVLSWHLYHSDDTKAAMRLFWFSIFYLFALFLSLLIDHYLIGA